MRVAVQSLQCKRCAYRWVPRKAEVRVCPKCHSPYWDRGRSLRGENSRFGTLLKKMVRKIVQACDPEKIILFGSHATGCAGPGSDVDLLVVTSQGVSRREQAVALYRVLRDVGAAKDIVVVRPEDFENYQDVVGTVIYPAAHEGKILYERAA